MPSIALATATCTPLWHVEKELSYDWTMAVCGSFLANGQFSLLLYNVISSTQKQLYRTWWHLDVFQEHTQIPVTFGDVWTLEVTTTACTTTCGTTLFVTNWKSFLFPELKMESLYFRTVRGGRFVPAWLGTARLGSGGPLGLALFVWTAGSNVASCSPGDWPGMWLKVSSGLIKRRPWASLLSPLSKKPKPSTLTSLLDLLDLTALCFKYTYRHNKRLKKGKIQIQMTYFALYSYCNTIHFSAIDPCAQYDPNTHSHTLIF